MTTITIKSAFHASDRTLDVADRDEDVHVRIHGDGIPSILVNRADLLSALGVDPITDGQARTLRNTVHAAVASRNAAETKLAEVRANWENECGNLEKAMQRAEKAEREASFEEQRGDQWRDAAFTAETIVAKAREAWAEVKVRMGANWEAFKLLDDALNGEPEAPAFELPTEAGARFEAQGDNDKIGCLTTFTTLIGGQQPLYMAQGDPSLIYSADGAMRYYTDHRLIEVAP